MSIEIEDIETSGLCSIACTVHVFGHCPACGGVKDPFPGKAREPQDTWPDDPYGTAETWPKVPRAADVSEGT